MKKTILFLAALAIALSAPFSARAADICTLAVTAEDCGDSLCFHITPQVDWNKIGSCDFDLLLAVYFCDRWKQPLKSTDGNYQAIDGQVSANVRLHRRIDSSDPITVCIPKAELNLPVDDSTLYYHVEAFRFIDGQFEHIGRSPQTIFELSGTVPQVVKPENDIVSLSRTYRFYWDTKPEVFETMHFSPDGTVERFVNYDGAEKENSKKGRYTLKPSDTSSRVYIRITWKDGKKETWHLEGTSTDHPLLSPDGTAWEPFTK